MLGKFLQSSDIFWSNHSSLVVPALVIPSGRKLEIQIGKKILICIWILVKHNLRNLINAVLSGKKYLYIAKYCTL